MIETNKSLSAEEANKLEATDPDYATRDLFNHIQGGKEAVWDVSAQFIPIEAGNNYKFNIFDLTKVVSQKDYPRIPIGRLVLNRNPQNYFAEVEQSAFAPAHLVPGIEPSPDRMLQARLFSYTDTHRHRLGPNYLHIPINCPYASRVTNQQRDGFMTVNGNGGSAPNYYPNTHPKSQANPEVVASAAIVKFKAEGVVGRYKHNHPNSDWEQPGIFFREVLCDGGRARLIANVAGALSGARREVQAKMIQVLTNVDKEYGRRVQEALSKQAKM